MNQLSLEINPSSCVLFLGPCMSQCTEGRTLSFTSFIEHGIQLLGQDERGRLLGEDESVKEDEWLNTTQQLDSLLTEKTLKGQWLTEYFTTTQNTIIDGPLLQLLLELQSQGCKLVYTFYDNHLNDIAGTEPILLSNVVQMERWLDGKVDGFFHIYGSITADINSLLLHDVTPLTKHFLFQRLKDLFNHKSLIFIGHDLAHLNTLLNQTVQLFLQEDSVIKNPPLFLSPLPHSSIPDSFLHLPVKEKTPLHQLIIISKDSLFTTGKVFDKTLDKEFIRSQAVLLFSEKQSFRKLGDIIYHLNKSGEIYVRRDALTVIFGTKIMYGNILTYGGKGLYQIWELVHPQGSILQNKGLVAIGLQNSILIWIAGKPLGLGSITDVTTFHSLWNNSASAINQSKIVTTPTSSSSGLLSSPSLISSSILPFNFLPFQTTPTPTGNILVPSNYPGQFILATPTKPLPVSMTTERTINNPIVSTGLGLPSTRMNLHSMGMSALPSIGMSLPKMTLPLPSMGMSLPSIGMSLPTTSTGMGPVVRASPSTPLSEGSADDSSASPKRRRTNNSCSDSSDNCIPTTGPTASISCAKLMKVDPPLTIEVTRQHMLIDYQENISVIEQSNRLLPSPLLPSSSRSLLPYPPLSFVPLPTPPSITGNSSLTRPFIISPPTVFNSILNPNSYPAFPTAIISPQANIQGLITSNNNRTISQLSPAATLPSSSTSSPNAPKQKTTIGNESRTTCIPNVPSISTCTLPTTNLFTQPIRLAPPTNLLTPPTNLLTPPTGINPLFSTVDGVNHLWQFLLRLLLSPNHGHVIQWTGNEYEFRITDHEKLIEMWAKSSGNPSLNFHSLTGELRSYTGLGILEKVEGKELEYQFKIDIAAYLRVHAETLSKEL